MSRYVGKPIEYKCLNDCQQSGCPGHTVTFIANRSSDIYSFEIDDGKTDNLGYTFDENQWRAMVQAYEVMRYCYRVQDDPKKRLTFWQSKFTVLKDWLISIGTGYAGQVTTNPDLPRATFFSWEKNNPANPEPSDFMLHEFLHLALRAWQRLPEVQRDEQEETLVREICAIFRERLVFSQSVPGYQETRTTTPAPTSSNYSYYR
jgi:hypothetical protein